MNVFLLKGGLHIINEYIDHTNLKAIATKKDIAKLCKEAVENNFKSVCINPCYILYAKELLVGTNVLICTVVGFPLGANTTIMKVSEALDAVYNGADEIDMVINIGALKDKRYHFIASEIRQVKEAIRDKTLKVIIETCYLNEEEIIEMTNICNMVGVDFIKTSTGYGSKGATLEDVKLIMKHKNSNLEVKASGGIKTEEEAVQYLKLGVKRIGTSSGINFMKGEK